MHNSDNRYRTCLDKVKHLVRKTAEQCAPHMKVGKGMVRGRRRDLSEGLADLVKKFVSEARSLSFIPVKGLSQIRLGLGPDMDLEAHPRLWLMRFRTSSAGAAAPGFLRQASSRSSIS